MGRGLSENHLHTLLNLFSTSKTGKNTAHIIYGKIEERRILMKTHAPCMEDPKSINSFSKESKCQQQWGGNDDSIATSSDGMTCHGIIPLFLCVCLLLPWWGQKGFFFFLTPAMISHDSDTNRFSYIFKNFFCVFLIWFFKRFRDLEISFLLHGFLSLRLTC
jgi:hypothetical protein